MLPHKTADDFSMLGLRRCFTGMPAVYAIRLAADFFNTVTGRTKTLHWNFHSFFSPLEKGRDSKMPVTTIPNCSASNRKRSDAAARLLELIQMRLISEAIYVAATLGVADFLTEPKSADELADSIGVCSSSLARVLQALVCVGVFSQEPDRRFALAPVGELLKRERTLCTVRQNSMAARQERIRFSCSSNASGPVKARLKWWQTATGLTSCKAISSVLNCSI